MKDRKFNILGLNMTMSAMNLGSSRRPKLFNLCLLPPHNRKKKTFKNLNVDLQETAF